MLHSGSQAFPQGWPFSNQLAPRLLVAVPIFNEGKTVDAVLGKILSFAKDVLVIDDGSTDDTPSRLRTHPGLHIVTHPTNRGYGAALIAAFNYCVNPPPGMGPFDGLVTLDCDGQHEPERIDLVAKHLGAADIVSASRYLADFPENNLAPPDRQRVNHKITDNLNATLKINITDAFCGFKAYRTDALAKLRITENGWGMPLQVWVQAARLGLKIVEVAIPRIYLDPNRTFGVGLTNPDSRMQYYMSVIDDALNSPFPPRVAPPLNPLAANCSMSAG